jgi:integrase/recombinase XerC
MTEYVKAFCKYLALNRSVSRHTVRAYESDLTQFLDHVSATARVKAADLAPPRSTAMRFAASSTVNAKGQSRGTAARKLAAIRTFLRYLRREEAIAADPGSLVRTPKREVRMTVHLTEEEMARLLDAPDSDDPLGRRDKAIVELFYASGLRLVNWRVWISTT